jgi:GNAT superfamily N-acetyltransferase
MLDIAEEHLPALRPDGRRELVVWCPRSHGWRQDLLRQRGYKQEGWSEHQWRRDLAEPLPDVVVPAGYCIRSLGDGLELLERCYASGLAFHQGDLQVVSQNRADPAWYRNIQTAPLYRGDLDLVAVASDGAFAAFCTIWLDDATRSAFFEPVATVPAHQRKGLGRAILTEGLHRLRRMGARHALVSGYSQAANALYRSVMGEDHEPYKPWAKTWPTSLDGDREYCREAEHLL